MSIQSLLVQPGSLSGFIEPPPSKSHTLRALLFALMASGSSQIEGPLSSPDTDAMIEGIKLLGAKVNRFPTKLMIEGVGGQLCPPEDVINCGNSGQVLRFLGALTALQPHYALLTGDASIRRNRPAQPLIDGLTQLGALAISTKADGLAPLIIRGPLTGFSARVHGADSQPISGLLIAASFAPHPIELFVKEPGEIPWIELTLSWLNKFQIPYERKGSSYYRLQGGARIPSFHYAVSCDWSSAAFPLIAALITGSAVRIGRLDPLDSQGDRAIVPLLEQMGASITWEGSTLCVHPAKHLQGRTIDVNPFIDALPILAVLGCFAEGQTLLYNGKVARHKESDRILAITTELRKMGACIEEREDGLLVRPSPLRGAKLSSHKDHRIAMSLCVAALAAQGESEIEGFDVTAKSFPSFIECFQKLGARLQEHHEPHLVRL